MATETDDPICFHCKKKTTKDMFCSGCKEFICEKCDNSLGLFGSHNKEEHLEYPSSESDEA